MLMLEHTHEAEMTLELILEGTVVRYFGRCSHKSVFDVKSLGCVPFLKNYYFPFPAVGVYRWVM